ncbi:hypothetical protein AXG93_4295s1230 [Marchantia polymorpha subsp. ruderalis]|uniref:C3H1-type domain-containing protein n=1 Tax=Marchantia polymorpha subsp. ruderalis TaxID=1480154 RepID=A0A176WAI0_MARPO|nr:hypothetical protein AXG93_4295s1230 [Marchantia polymorpha subsp. ruderalis]
MTKGIRKSSSSKCERISLTAITLSMQLSLPFFRVDAESRGHDFFSLAQLLLQETAGIETAPQLGYQPDSLRSPQNLVLGPTRLSAPPISVPAPLSIKSTTRPSIEVCRDYVRGRCSRDAEDCRFAHHNPTGGDGEYVIISVGPTPLAVEHYDPGPFDAPLSNYAARLYEHQAAKRMRIEEHAGDPHRRCSPGPITVERSSKRFIVQGLELPYIQHQLHFLFSILKAALFMIRTNYRFVGTFCIISVPETQHADMSTQRDIRRLSTTT